MGKGCPSCHMQSWKICPHCGEYTCAGCGKSRGGKKQSANNICNYCGKSVPHWKNSSKSPSWATY